MNAWLVREHNPNPDTRLPSEDRTASYGVFLQEEPPHKLRLPGITWGVAMLADLVLNPTVLAELTDIRLHPGDGPILVELSIALVRFCAVPLPEPKTAERGLGETSGGCLPG